MESLQSTKNRLKAVTNVGQITKAMEVVAATKMRRAQESALASRPYSYEALYLLERLLSSGLPPQPLTLSREVKKTLVLVVTSDRGLAGSFNSQVFRLLEQFLTQDRKIQAYNHQYLFVAVGNKAEAYLKRQALTLQASFPNAADLASPLDISPLSDLLVTGFLAGDWDRVVTISTNFRTALKQEPLVRQLLPLAVEKIKQTITEIVPEHGRFADEKTPALNTDHVTDYLLEPSASEVITQLLPRLVLLQLYHLMLEAKASEHSARRVAMKTASDNAQDLSDTLLLNYNKARQVGITSELSEITTTIMTLSD